MIHAIQQLSPAAQVAAVIMIGLVLIVIIVGFVKLATL